MRYLQYIPICGLEVFRLSVKCVANRLRKIVFYDLRVQCYN